VFQVPGCPGPHHRSDHRPGRLPPLAGFAQLPDDPPDHAPILQRGGGAVAGEGVGSLEDLREGPLASGPHVDQRPARVEAHPPLPVDREQLERGYGGGVAYHLERVCGLRPDRPGAVLGGREDRRDVVGVPDLAQSQRRLGPEVCVPLAPDRLAQGGTCLGDPQVAEDARGQHLRPAPVGAEQVGEGLDGQRAYPLQVLGRAQARELRGGAQGPGEDLGGLGGRDPGEGAGGDRPDGLVLV
jgi:hypothetical protein